METSKYIKRLRYLTWFQGVIGVSCLIGVYFGLKSHDILPVCGNAFLAGFSLAQVLRGRDQVKRFTKEDLTLEELRRRVDAPETSILREIPRGAIFPMEDKPQ